MRLQHASQSKRASTRLAPTSARLTLHHVCAGRQLLTQKGFFALGRACRQLADKHAGGRMVLTQEGGYNLSYTAFCVHAVLEARAAFGVRMYNAQLCARRV